MLNIFAIITAKPGMRAQLLDSFNANIPAVLAEEGCIEYAATIDAEGLGDFQTKIGDDSFAVVEKWESKEALMAHAVAPHMKDYAKATRDMVEDRAIYILSAP